MTKAEKERAAAAQAIRMFIRGGLTDEALKKAIVWLQLTALKLR